MTVLCGELTGPLPNPSKMNLIHVPGPRSLSHRHFDQRVREMLPRSQEQSILTVEPYHVSTHYQIHAGMYARAFSAEQESMVSFLKRKLFPLGQALNLRRRWLLSRQGAMLQEKDPPNVMVFSKKVLREVQDHCSITPKRVCLFPIGVDLHIFQPARPEGPKGGKELRLLFVAHNFVLKGLHCLFEALGQKNAVGPNIHLCVAGNGPIATFERLAKKHGITSRVTFLGGIDQERLIDCYQNSHALVHPTFYDHCSLVTLEALACGCPVITIRQNGASELFESGKEGLILDHPRNTPALCEALNTIQDRGILGNMRQAALQLRGRLSVKHHLKGVMKWLEL